MAEITVYGAPWCPDCKRAKRFLAEHRVAYNWVDIDQDAEGRAEVERLQSGGRTIPTIVFPDRELLLEPTDEELARKLGLSLTPDRPFYDLAIVGGGPAGLSAAIYAAREGIDAIVIDQGGLGGQSGVTERIDNYPGFPEGIGGAELADRFIAQARRYGVELLAAVAVDAIDRDEEVRLRLSTGAEIAAHASIVAPGSSYRRLEVTGEDRLIGAGVHFCATCDGPFYRGSEELVVIGGGNSALEEGLFLSQFAKRIRVLQRAPELTASRLLQEKVSSHPQFQVQTNVEVREFEGDQHLQAVLVRDLVSGEESRVVTPGAFIFIGLDPNTAFLRGRLELDRWGFITTEPYYETSLRGVFAAGDARAGSTKQLGSAVGEGIAALLEARRFLEAHRHMAPVPIDA